MSKWSETLEALMRDRGPALYGYAFALTESRDAADDLVKEALYRTFRRGAGPATIEHADDEVREQMRALSAEDRVRAVTDASQSESVDRAIAAGMESLGSRDMTDAIGPATRRARKHRRNVALSWSASVLVAIGAVWITASVIAGEPAPEPSPDRERVEQGLGGVLVAAVTGVEHRAIDLVGDQPHRARTRMANDDDIGAHGVERHRGIDQRLALLHARLRGMHVDHIGAEPLSGDLEREQRSGRIFEEGVDDGQAGKPVIPFLRLAVQFHPLLCFVEQKEDFVRSKTGYADKSAMREGGAARRVAS